ncbi:cytochrome c oxidase copper chaperone-like [Phyllostomus discolor]|uniref:Cytochrome c oxidase copper chaperone-like n=1 Tax=Phyllostomus discolor TaxID=89673 RepID=A0A7E6CTX4_9CHIR|nr:cytochrome c oxidase copper chaperone-like [Phyllostomus discolor]
MTCSSCSQQDLTSLRIRCWVVAASSAPSEMQEKKPLKPCCACPDTKKVPNVCILEKGGEHCGHLIEAHKECMRALEFKI